MSSTLRACASKFRAYALLTCLAVLAANPPVIQAQERIGQDESLHQAMVAARHMIEPDTSGRLRAYNPAQRLRAEFAPGAAWLEHPEAGRFALALAGIQRGVLRQRPAPATPVAAGSRVEYRRGAGLVEWWQNGPDGLEQGFTLRDKLAGRGALEVALRLEGGLRARRENAGGASLLREGRAVLRYSGLRAWDSGGRELPSRMRVAGHSIRLIVDDGDAQYPITVDPLVHEFTLTASDGAPDDQFGYAVAVSNDTAVVGAPMNDTPAGSAAGSAYVFVRDINGWILEAKLNASDGRGGDQFGTSVAIGGNTIVVGAFFHSTGSTNHGGAAYVFVRTGGLGSWTQQAKLVPSDPRHYDEFARSVAVNGDTAVIGAPRHPTKLNFISGAAYVFVRGAGGWRQEAQLLPRRYEVQQFGWSVGVFGNKAIVGAPGAKDNSGTPTGVVYTFTRNGGTWQEESWHFGTQYGERFGHSVAISGDSYVVGAPGYDYNNRFDGGAAYAYYRNSLGLDVRQLLVAGDVEPAQNYVADNFGYSVAIDGPNVLIGAYRDNTPAGEDAGSAWMFVRNGDRWYENTHLFASEPAAGDQFGHSVAIAGGAVVVGAPMDDTRAGADAGSAHVFRSVVLTPVTISSNPTGLRFTVTGLGCEPGTYSADKTLNWARGSSCTVSFASPQNGAAGTRYVFANWADGSKTSTRTFTVPATATTYTAQFTTQYLLSMSIRPAGAGSLTGGGFYNSGAVATVAVYSVSTGYRFLNWTGPVASPTSASTTVLMDWPQSVTANFQLRTRTTVAPATGIFRQTITLSATIGPSGAFTGTLQFQVSGVNAGSPIPVTGSGTYTMPYYLDRSPGSYPISAVFTSSTELASSSSGSNTLIITNRR